MASILQGRCQPFIKSGNAPTTVGVCRTQYDDALFQILKKNARSC